MKLFTDKPANGKGLYSALDGMPPLTPYGDVEGRPTASSPSRKGQHSRRQGISIATIFHIVAESAILILLSLLVWKSFKKSSSDNCALPTYGNDARVSSGPFNQHLQFGHNDKYASLSHKQDYLWSEFSEDFGDIEFPASSSSSSHNSSSLANYGSISMFHSLHCLMGMRKAMQKLGEGNITLVKLQDDPHVPHCFDYLRQSLLCFADDTFELARNEKGIVDGMIIEGAYDVRTCRDSTRLYDLAYKYKVKEEG